MEKINTDYKRWTWKIQAELFKVRKPSRSPLLKGILDFLEGF